MRGAFADWRILRDIKRLQRRLKEKAETMSRGPTLCDGSLATPDYIVDQLGDALDILRGIESVGMDDLDADLLAAEQAIRRVKLKLKQ
jgi:hypothetical protein